MTKKRILLLTVVAAIVFAASFGMSACKKNVETNGIPVVRDTLVPGKTPTYTAICPHHDASDPARVMVIDGSDPYAIVHHTHEYMEGEPCRVSTCEWAGHHHIHEVYFWRGHYEEDWDHLGGCSHSRGLFLARSLRGRLGSSGRLLHRLIVTSHKYYHPDTLPKGKVSVFLSVPVVTISVPDCL